MLGTMKLIERIEMTLRNTLANVYHTIYIDVYDNSLSRKWLDSLVSIIKDQLHLEKNYCFVGFPHSTRNGQYICDSINDSIKAINSAEIRYRIDDDFNLDRLLHRGDIGDDKPGLQLDHDAMNRLHRYFEDLQGVSGSMSPAYQKADTETRWHIRQLNLLCHELEIWSLSYRKAHYAPEWVRPSQLMCWLQSPRFLLEDEDYDLFGLHALQRTTGGIYVGINKAVGKTHWEVFVDEGEHATIDKLTTSTLRPQSEAAGDFDIEWARDTKSNQFMAQYVDRFERWMRNNGFDPDNRYLTIGHPCVGQINLLDNFGSENIYEIWNRLSLFNDVYKISVAGVSAKYDYSWQDLDYKDRQISALNT